MSSSILRESEFAALVELSNLLGRPSFARDIAAACEMASISGRRVAVAGLVKRGKSTFVNRVVGEELSPVNLLPETSSVICFQRGDVALARGIAFDGSLRELSTKPSSFSSDVSREARRPLLAASYCGPLNLPINFCLVDTPGAHESEVTVDSLVESGMPSSLFHLCGGFIVVMGVPGLSGIDLQLLDSINRSAGELPVRVLLKGLDSSISQSALLDYSREVLSDVKNEIFVVSDEDFSASERLIHSFAVSYFDSPNDAREVSELVVNSVLDQIRETLNSRDEALLLNCSTSLLKNLPPDIADGVRYFAPGASERRKAYQLEVAKRAENDKYRSELNTWMIKDQELRRAISNSDQGVRDAEKRLREGKPSGGCGTGILFALSFVLFPFGPIIAAVLIWMARSGENSKFEKIEGSLNGQIAQAKERSIQARKLHENHQKFKPNKPAV